MLRDRPNQDEAAKIIAARKVGTMNQPIQNEPRDEKQVAIYHGVTRTLQSQIDILFDLKDARIEHLDTLVNDIAVITAPAGRFALKLYNVKSHALKDVQWELGLIEHLVEHDAPVVRPVRGKHGYVETIIVDDQERAAAVFEWAPGEKPEPSHETYILLGEAAARIHSATDTFHPTWMREHYDARELIDEQIERMEHHLAVANCYDKMAALGERLKTYIADPMLDQGICHMDLTLDNVHVHNGKIAAFDFDSAGYCWRAMEPYGVLRFSEAYFRDWLSGYHSVRPFSEADERAVYTFAIIGDLRNVVWKLGEARSSRGKPLLTAQELPKIVDEYLEWEHRKISGS